MPKSKHAPALFELISRPPRGEGWRARAAEPEVDRDIGEPAPPAPPAACSQPVASDPVVTSVPPSVRPAVKPVEQQGGAESPLTWAGRSIAGWAGRCTGWWRGWWAISGGRIEFSLTQRGATIALGAVGLVLILAHYLGYSLGERRGRERALASVTPVSAPLSGIEATREGPVTRRLFEGVGEDPTHVVAAAPVADKPAPPVATASAARFEPRPSGWVQGHTYIVVQDFRKDARADAERAQEYLERSGIPCVILERSGNYPYRLITAQGFDRDNQVQRKTADDYQQRVRRLGQGYLEAGGRYDFKTAYFIKLTGETW